MNFTEQELEVLSFINFSKLPDLDLENFKNGKESQTRSKFPLSFEYIGV